MAPFPETAQQEATIVPKEHYLVVKVTVPDGSDADPIRAFESFLELEPDGLAWEVTDGPFDTREEVGESLFDIDS